MKYEKIINVALCEKSIDNEVNYGGPVNGSVSSSLRGGTMPYPPVIGS